MQQLVYKLRSLKSEVIISEKEKKIDLIYELVNIKQEIQLWFLIIPLVSSLL